MQTCGYYDAVPRSIDFVPPPVFAGTRPQVFGHRGGLALGPENTMLAFARGLAAGADGFECDVRLSADGVPVVIHDATLDRTTSATGPVGAMTAVELAGVDATCRFEPASPGWAVPRPEGVPALADVLTRFPEARLIIEIKDEDPVLGELAADLVRRLDAVQRVCLGSFHQAVLDRVRSAAPELTTSASSREARALLLRARVRWPGWTAPRFRALQVPQARGWLRVVTPSFVRRAHREGASVHVWTVNQPEHIRTLLAMGVDGIISDRPDVAVTVREAKEL